MQTGLLQPTLKLIASYIAFYAYSYFWHSQWSFHPIPVPYNSLFSHVENDQSNKFLAQWKSAGMEKMAIPSTFWLLCVQDIFPVYLQSFGAQIHSHYERCKISCGRWSAQSKHILKVGYPLSPLFVHLFRKCSFFKLLHMIPGILFHSSKMFEEIMIDCFLFVIEQWTNERLFSSTLHILVK